MVMLVQSVLSHTEDCRNIGCQFDEQIQRGRLTLLGLGWSGDTQMYWIKPIRNSFLKGLVFIHKDSWLCIYENIPLLVHILLLMMMRYDAIGLTYSNKPSIPAISVSHLIQPSQQAIGIFYICFYVCFSSLVFAFFMFSSQPAIGMFLSLLCSLFCMFFTQFVRFF